MKRRATARKTATKAKPPTKRAKTTNQQTPRKGKTNERVTFSSRVIQADDDQPAKLVNWLADDQVNVASDGLSFSHLGYSFGTTRGSVGVSKGLWYYEVTLSSNTSARVGWATGNFKPAQSDGVGCDSESWGINGSQQKKYFNDTAKLKGRSNDYSYGYGTREVGESYGSRYWNNGTVVGCLLDLDTSEMSFTYNGESMGVAFHVTIPAGGHLRPCVSLYRGTNVSVNFGPDFKYKPAGFYGLNTTVEGDERDSLIELFKKYQSQGESAITSNSLTLNIMRSVGVSALLTDLGVTGQSDPHLFLLAWKMRPRAFCEIYEDEWCVLWGLERAFAIEEMKEAVARWMEELKDPFCLSSFYNYTFDYLLLEKGSNATALTKEDSINVWNVLDFGKKWALYSKWIDFCLKGVTRDTWKMLPRLIERIGDDPSKYNEDDFWPTAIDDFVLDYLANN